MYYVCVENDQIVSVLNYEPNVPESVTVYQISDEDQELLKKRTHYFNIKEGSVQPNPTEKNEEIEKERQVNEALVNLSRTDWKVLRHMREKTLGITTTLTEDQYLELEFNRQKWVETIRSN